MKLGPKLCPSITRDTPYKDNGRNTHEIFNMRDRYSSVPWCHPRCDKYHVWLGKYHTGCDQYSTTQDVINTTQHMMW